MTPEQLENNTSPPTPPSSPTSKKPFIILGIVVIAVILLGGGYFLGKTQNSSKELTTSLTPTSVTSSLSSIPPADPTANWTTFSFKENPFSFKYPPILLLRYFPIDTNGVFDGDRMATYENAVLKNGTTKILGINPNQLGLGFTNTEDTKTEPVMINGKPSNKIVSSDGSYYVLVKYGDKTLFTICYNQPSTCDQILSTFKFTSLDTQVKKLTFSDGTIIELQLSNDSVGTDQPAVGITKINTNSYTLNSLIKLSYSKSLQELLLPDSFIDSDGNAAATGIYFDKDNTIVIHNLNFNKQISYYNPIKITKSGKYDPKISSPTSISCVLRLPDNRGVLIFGLVDPVPVGTDACDFVRSLKSLNVKNS